MSRPAFRAVVVAATLLLCSDFDHAQNGPPAHPPRPKLVGPAQWKPSAQEVSAAYWSLEPGWSTTLEMRNNLVSHELTVTPVLRAGTGQETSLGAVTIAPQHVVSLDLRTVAQGTSGMLDRMGSFGSVAFRFDGLGAPNLLAASMVRREGQPIDFHFDADDSYANYLSAGIEGIWWLPAASSTDYLILSNPLKKKVTGSLVLSSSSAASRRLPVSIEPGETKRFDVRELVGPSSNAAMGGLSLVLPKKEVISATQVVFDEVTGLAATMKLFYREPGDKIESHLLRAPMMALTQPDRGLAFPRDTTLSPRIFLRNAGSTSTQFALSVDWRTESRSGNFPFPRLTLSPGQVRVISLAEYQKAGQIPLDASWGVVNLAYTGRSADLVPVAISYDEDNRYGLQTPFSEALSRMWAGGMWHVDPTHNTLITTGNGGTETTAAEVTLFYNGGKSKYRIEKMLAPGQQLWLDVGHLVHDQVPDSDGHVLPPDTMTGSYELRDLDHAYVGQLYEGKLIMDKTYGHAAYGCGTCCGLYDVVLDPSPFDGPTGIANNDYIHATEQCGGLVGDYTGGGYNWASSNTAVATLPNRTLHTVAVGAAKGSAVIQLETTHAEPGGKCPNITWNPQQPVTVTPTISQNQPLWYFGGNPAPSGFTLGSTTVTLTAVGGSGGTYAWSITSGSSIAALQGSTTGASVQITSKSYSTSTKDVTVQLQFTPTGGSTTPVNYSLTVDSPYKLVAGSIVDYGISLNSPSCSNAISGKDGYDSVLSYTIFSFTGLQIGNVAVNETFAGITDDYIGNNWPWPSPLASDATSQGTFVDIICVVGPALTPPSLPPPQSSSVKIDHALQSWFAGSLTEAAGVEVQSDTLQRYQDHGRHLSILSPTR